ncbi:MAG: hypothetical protein JWO83_1933 [Caulobacteraceae bacterium]|jgi:hypothetical protein|nr:hypothetical protein [Caulobacteraceae bacterium]
MPGSAALSDIHIAEASVERNASSALGAVACSE